MNYIRTKKDIERIRLIGKANKDRIPWNKGTRGICKPNVGSFKNNSIPYMQGKKHTEETKKKMSLSHMGNKDRWLGGRVKHSEGYILIYQPLHPFVTSQGYIMEHRLVMEKYLGRYLAKEEEIHHINGIKTDNQIENLMLFKNKSEHIKYENCLCRK